MWESPVQDPFFGQSGERLQRASLSRGPISLDTHPIDLNGHGGMLPYSRGGAAGYLNYYCQFCPHITADLWGSKHRDLLIVKGPFKQVEIFVPLCPHYACAVQSLNSLEKIYLCMAVY